MGLPKGRNFGLDLFRVLAEFSVLLAHFLMWVAYAERIDGMQFMLIIGSVGLEFFFVMSGFLIGGMLLDITDRGVSVARWKEFTIRRLLRVLPPYLVWLAVLWTFYPPASEQQFNILSFLTFTQNLAWASVGGQWFDVSWSLSVEFWFYISFGALSLIAFKNVGRVGFLVVTLLYIFIPLFLRVLFHDLDNWDLSIRKVVVFQLDAIAYGVLLVYAVRKYPLLLVWRNYLAVAGGIVIFCSVAWWWWSEHQFNVQLPFNKAFILNLILAGLCLIFPWVLCVRCDNRWVVQVVEWLSDTSYAVYLVHLTVAGWCIWFLKNQQPILFVVFAIGVSLMLGGLSWHLIEKPILSRRPSVSFAKSF
jgi:peptidoglycan/LPS O-acetylase OafA/YrhL